MEKTKYVDFKDGLFTIDTTIKAGRRTLELHGQPCIVIFGGYVQFGCLRFSHAALRALAAVADAPCGVIQYGDYETNDPNTQAFNIEGGTCAEHVQTGQQGVSGEDGEAGRSS